MQGRTHLGRTCPSSTAGQHRPQNQVPLASESQCHPSEYWSPELPTPVTAPFSEHQAPASEKQPPPLKPLPQSEYKTPCRAQQPLRVPDTEALTPTLYYRGGNGVEDIGFSPHLLNRCLPVLGPAGHRGLQPRSSLSALCGLTTPKTHGKSTVSGVRQTWAQIQALSFTGE